MALVVKNNGSTEWRGKNSCRVEFQVENTATGEITRMRKTFRVDAQTKKEKGRCLREFREELENGLSRDAQHTTLQAYADEWLASRKASPEIAARTIKKEGVRLSNIYLHLGGMLIGEITARDIRNFLTAIRTIGPDGKAPTVSGRPASGTTAQGIFRTLKQVFEQAIDDELIASSPCARVKAPTSDTKEKEPLSRTEAARFRALLDASTPRPTLVAFRLMLFAGLRRGEVCGLKWSDFDDARGTISVNRSLDTETLEFKEPKTEAGFRVIPLDPATIAYLQRFRASQAEKALRMGTSLADSCICAKVGTAHMHPENLSRSLRRFGAANGFKGVTPHILRHTYCTLLFEAGVDLKTVQHHMGHSDPTLTMRIYTHYSEGKGIQAGANLGALMDATPTTNVIKLDKPEGRWGITTRSA